MSKNARVIENFIDDKNRNIIFGIKIDEKENIFYKYFINEVLSEYKISLRGIENDDEINFQSSSLFEENEFIYLSFKKLKNEGRKKLINFLPYKDVKKYKNVDLINSYEIDNDIMFILKKNSLENEDKLFNYLKLNPHMIEFEIKKILVNKKGASFDNFHISHEGIYSIRMEFFKTKKTSLNLKKLFGLYKKEALYKKFNFLVY